MKQVEFANIMAAMNAAYPHEKITCDSKKVKLWWNHLKDMDYKAVSKNLNQYIDVNEYPPSIADLRNKKPVGFDNFVGRNYDMNKLELALLGVNRVEGIEEIKNNGGTINV